MSYSVGIGYTTRNRMDVLDLCLEEFQKHLPKCEFKFVVCDDASDNPDRSNYQEMLKKYSFVEYHKSEERQGIAKNKNLCIKHLKDCDHIFLFDDDAWAKSDGWSEFFINAAEKNGINHLLYQIDVPWLGLRGERDGILEFNNSGGVMMYLTKKAIDTIGGFDSRMGIYGMEHSQLSMRVHASGLMNGFHMYCSPKGAEEFIFSLDINMNVAGQVVPHRPDFHQGKYEFVSSLEGEQELVQGYISHNSQFLYSLNPLYKPFE